MATSRRWLGASRRNVSFRTPSTCSLRSFPAYVVLAFFNVAPREDDPSEHRQHLHNDGSLLHRSRCLSECREFPLHSGRRALLVQQSGLRDQRAEATASGLDDPPQFFRSRGRFGHLQLVLLVWKREGGET